MIPVKQTIIGFKNGNCMAACVASILELSIDEVPNFADNQEPNDYKKAFLGYLNSRGLHYLKLFIGNLDDDHLMYVAEWKDHYVIMSGKSPRGEADHAVVGQANGWHFEIVHDPHPDGAGLDGPPQWVTFLLKA